MKKAYYTADIAETYGKDRFNIYTTVRKASVAQLKSSILALSSDLTIDTLVDVAVGKGDHLLNCQSIFNIKHMVGNDISAPMLAYAKKRLPNMQAICDTAVNISQHIQAADVVFAHFVLSYLSVEKILMEIHKVLVPNGILSIATSTLNNLGSLQKLLNDNIPYLINSNKIHNKHTHGIPPDRAYFLQLLNEYGFEVLQEEVVRLPVELRSFDDLWEFLVDEGWGIQYLDRTGNRVFDKFMAKLVITTLQFLYKQMRFPLTSQTDICVVTCKKRSTG